MIESLLLTDIPSLQHYHHPKEEEEPEWMEFGPTDRFELIELKGLDEHEREREGGWGLA